MPDNPPDPNTARVDAVRRALGRALSGWERKLLQRDAAELGGDVRRANGFSREINEILGRLQSEDTREALSRPLGAAFGAPLTDPQTNIDRDRLRVLTDLLVDPLTRNLPNAKSPLAYVAPKMLSEDERQKLIELSIEATAKGASTAELAQLLADELPASQRLLRGEFDKGPTLFTEGGARVQAGRYAEMLARTTTYYASNQGTVERAIEADIPCVKFTTAPGCHDFCLDLNNCIFALTEEAAETYGVPMVSEIPGGSVPTHPNCRCVLAPFTPRRSDKGKLTTAPKDSLAAPGADRRGAQREAQNAFEARLEQNPLPYAEQLAESAARRGFGPRSVKLQGRDKQLAGVPIPGLPPGQKEFFGAAKSRALAEDVHLIKRMKDSGISSRKELRQTVADALRAGAESGDVVATDSGRMIYYSRASDWAVVIDPADGLVVSGFPLKLAGQTWEADYKAKYK